MCMIFGFGEWSWWGEYFLACFQFSCHYLFFFFRCTRQESIKSSSIGFCFFFFNISIEWFGVYGWYVYSPSNWNSMYISCELNCWVHRSVGNDLWTIGSYLWSMHNRKIGWDAMLLFVKGVSQLVVHIFVVLNIHFNQDCVLDAFVLLEGVRTCKISLQRRCQSDRWLWKDPMDPLDCQLNTGESIFKIHETKNIKLKS